MKKATNPQRKARLSFDGTVQQREHLDALASEMGISRAKLIEIAVEEKLGGVNVHQENQRLTHQKALAVEARENAEQSLLEEEKRCATLKTQRDDIIEDLMVILSIPKQDNVVESVNEIKKRIQGLFNQIHDLTEQESSSKTQVSQVTREKEKLSSQLQESVENLKTVATHLGVPDTPEHCNQRIDEITERGDTLESEKSSLIEQRDEFEQLTDALKRELRNCNARYISKFNRLMERNWFDRLRNVLPWAE